MIRRFLSLPFLPLNEIEEAHTEMMEDVDLNNTQIAAFCDYHLDTWLKDGAMFPKEMWNQYGNFCDRTNNAVEGWHSALNKAVGKAHPKIYELIHVIKEQQASFEITVRFLDQGRSTVTKKKKYVDLNESVKKLTEMYNVGAKTRIQFLNCIGYALKNQRKTVSS
ncbi:uncharacterized protein B4U80_05280 [Leptotrombidium deliense]|uniref:MULE transposase domain-containing protein n=1 Tax=Leptotrombidium deliense TaxID=299467 RepID=A0A443RYX2_9ACAR|nr:uncharacterized protein B4U80_05280 [Leptotrombidium deliense]